MPHVEPLRAGDPAAVGPYRLAGRLGAGGRGVVYLGRTRTGALVAVKVLHEGLVAGDRLAAAVAAARTVEPYGVARVLDASTEGRAYIVSEYVDGPSLRQSGRLTGDDLRHLAVVTATALTAVHRAGLVHGSLTPTNVLLAADGPRLTDFTLLHCLTPPHPPEQLAGTLAYAAPEQVAGPAVGAAAGAAADVFSWGAVLVFAATGTPPFGDDAPSAVIHRVLHDEPRLGDLPRALREVVAACLAKDPAARPGMRDVVLRLTASARRPTPPPAAPDWERTPDRAWDAPTLHPAPPAQMPATAPPAQAEPDVFAHAAAQETEEWDAPHGDFARPAKTGQHPVFAHPNASPLEAVPTPPPLTHHHTSPAPAAWPHHDGTGEMRAGGPSAFAAGQDSALPPTGPTATAPHHDPGDEARAGGPSAIAAGRDGPVPFATGQEHGRATEAGGGGDPLRTGESRGEHPAVPAFGQGGGDGGGRRRVLTVVVAVLAGVVVVVLGGAIWWLTPATPDTVPSPESSAEPSGRGSTRASTGRSDGAFDGGAGESSGRRGTASSTAADGGLAVVYLRPEGVRAGGCWSGGEVTLRALVRRNGGATALHYTWVVDGAPIGRSSALVAENGRRYLIAPQTLRGTGGTHEVSLRITAPAVVQRTITVTMCES
ncbi:Serine/threonine protein kinase [Nonomuraea maritima]|uniref:Serine/threonine protein kinase n=1 Tax=Nonomuraea maritima TaxID=683260 RepID=A0A1G8W936_9ACTN|nr:protein kinase [Nonomuraea maritima]SDJ74703.1 Serine/threonine protein kinase [Nonomuraea maritima]